MKKLFSFITILSMVLVFGSIAMAQNCPTRTETSMNSLYDSRAYHQSYTGTGSTVGGWAFNIGFKKELPFCADGPAELLAWTNEVTSKEIELRNNLSGNSYFMKPTFCYNTPSSYFKDDPIPVPVYSCDAVVWFGNKLNVTDGITTNNNMANMDVYIDGEYKNTLVAADDSRLSLFPYPEILGGKKAMSIVGDQIMIYYNVPDLPNTRLDILIFDSLGNTVFKQNGLIRGGQTFIYVPVEHSGHTGRFQLSTTDNLPTVRKATVFTLP